MKHSHPTLYLITLALLATTGCASTRLETHWSDPHYSGGPFRKPMIIGLGATEGGRAEFENSVADALLAHGVTGVSCTGYFASAQDMTRGSVAVGKLADLLVFDANPFDKPALDIHSVRADITVVGGTIVWRTR